MEHDLLRLGGLSGTSSVDSSGAFQPAVESRAEEADLDILLRSLEADLGYDF
eukprot:CAMPEP_0116980776 /NCGR_PEP_ID=MMETSP0467-20121206/59280_1 /TAXON_ID=283647 /ORGANISM="Mesodinium pulex, Strain SPMC105" /LENGTH=51 /DNA_ID=CAMNT_0004674805 /DNA_START=24 /DNA_END=176 /DNA_ORIENTATION=+